MRLLPTHWALIGLAIAMVLAVSASLHGGESVRHAHEHRSRLAERIARLDLRHESGEIAEAEYFRERGQQLESLLLLEQQAKSARTRRSTD